MVSMTGYVVPLHAVEGFFGTLREELILEKTDISITFCVLGMIGMKTNSEIPSSNFREKSQYKFSDC